MDLWNPWRKIIEFEAGDFHVLKKIKFNHRKDPATNWSYISLKGIGINTHCKMICSDEKSVLPRPIIVVVDLEFTETGYWRKGNRKKISYRRREKEIFAKIFHSTYFEYR